MPKLHKNQRFLTLLNAITAMSIIKVTNKSTPKIPFPFTMDALAQLVPVTKHFFGCLSIYIGSKIVLVQRNKPDNIPEDNGLWVAIHQENHAAFKAVFPGLRPVTVMGSAANWLNLPLESETFETDALAVCRLICKADPRIGNIPQTQKEKNAAV